LLFTSIKEHNLFWSDFGSFFVWSFWGIRLESTEVPKGFQQMNGHPLVVPVLEEGFYEAKANILDV
jgi:hypothetical protein